MKWISVKERLPIVEDEYLVCDRASPKEVRVAFFNFIWGFSSQEIADFTYPKNITHWMELPKPPETELSINGKLLEFVNGYIEMSMSDKKSLPLKTILNNLKKCMDHVYNNSDADAKLYGNEELLKLRELILNIEDVLGRKRSFPNGPRGDKYE